MLTIDPHDEPPFKVEAMPEWQIVAMVIMMVLFPIIGSIACIYFKVT